MTKIKVQDHPDLVKDKESAAVLAADIQAYNAHINKRKQQNKLESRIDAVESKIDNIEKLLMNLCNSLNNR